MSVKFFGSSQGGHPHSSPAPPGVCPAPHSLTTLPTHISNIDSTESEQRGGCVPPAKMLPVLEGRAPGWGVPWGPLSDPSRRARIPP